MKIMFVSSGFLPLNVGGVELHVYNLAKELKRQGHDVLVFCREYAPGKEEFALERTMYEQIQVARMNYKFTDCDSFEKIYSNPNIARIFRSVMKEYAPDLLHIHHLSCLTVDIAKIAKEAGVPVVMTLHDFWMGCPRGQRITSSLATCPEIMLNKCLPCLRELWPSFFEGGQHSGNKAEADARDLGMLENYHADIRGVLDGVDRLVTPSRFMKDVYIRFGISGARIAVVENGLDHDLFKNTVHARSSLTRFGYIGSILPSKGVHILIEAFKLIGASDLRLNIWGEVLPFHKDTNYGHRLAVLTKGWESSIQFHGRYENKELPGMLSNIDVLVVPSIWYEAFCLTMREGFLAGVPVIASNFGAMAEAVEDNETGLLFNVGDCVDLSRKMARLMDDASLRRKLIESPKNVFTVKENLAGLKKVYSDVSGKVLD